MLRKGLLLFTALYLVSGFAHRKEIAERYIKDKNFRERLDRHLAGFPSAPIANGAPNFNCPNMVSQTVPTTVHSLRPGDIKIVAAIGDSLTAGNGADATNILEVLLEYRGEAFAMGGDDDLATRHFNPQLFGQSYKIGPPTIWDIAYLNAAISGDIAAGLPQQAHALIARMQSHPDKIDIQNDWKLLTIFVGANDVCNYCVDKEYFSPANYVKHIRTAIQAIYTHIPRVLVQIISPLHVEIARVIDAAHPLCQEAHILFECQCEFNHNFSDEEFSKIVTEYQQALNDLMMSGDFDNRTDFSVVVQPFLDHTVQPPLNPDGTPNLSLFAPDCFHFRGALHSAVARVLWNTMMVPVGQKQQQFNFTDIYLPLNCPDPVIQGP